MVIICSILKDSNRLEILLHEHLKETGLSHPADLVAATLLFVSENSEVDPCVVEAEDQGLSDFLNSCVKGSGASDKIKKFSMIPLREVFDFKLLQEALSSSLSFCSSASPRDSHTCIHFLRPP